MLYFYMLLAHLVSDYILQPDKLVEWKNRSPWGLFVHASIHFLFANLVLFLYTGNWQVVFPALLLAIFHFTIDGVKAAHDRAGGHGGIYYWLDQFAHYLSILLVALLTWQFNGLFAARSWRFANVLDQLFFNPLLITFACLAIFVTLTVEYGGPAFQGKIKNARLDFKKMIKRLFLATIVYFGLLFALVPGVGVYFGG